MIFKKQLLFILFVCLATTVSAQKTWEKPFQKWKKEDAMKILTDSPWAKTYQSPNALARTSQEQVSREQSAQVIIGRTATNGSSGRTVNPSPVVIRLNSALPVRQAMVRLQQIEAGYDKMNDQQKAQFDESAKNYLACAICKNYYVVSITKFVDSSLGSTDDGIFQTMTMKEIKGNVFLVNDKGEKREVIQFTAPKRAGDSAVFFFQRNDEKGNPFLSPESKEFKFVFNSTFLETGNAYGGLVPRQFDFSVNKILIGDKLEF